jgi:cell division protein FtsA
MSGIRLEANFHIITGQIAAAKNIHRCAHKSGLKVTELVLEPLASAEAVLSDEEKEIGVALVDIGGGTTDIAIFQDGIIRHTAVIPFGGNIMTEDIKEGCAIIRHQAELLKVKFGSALASEAKDNEIVSIPGIRGREPREISLKNLANIIQARMEEIIELIYFEIRNSGFEKKLHGGIVLTGGGANLKHLPQLVAYITGMDVRMGFPNEHLSSGNTTEVTSPMYSTGVGLVMIGLTFSDKLKSKNITIESFMGDAIPEAPKPVAEVTPEPTDTHFEETTFEEPQAEVEPDTFIEEELPKTPVRYFSGFRGIKQKLEGWLNEGID